MHKPKSNSKSKLRQPRSQPLLMLQIFSDAPYVLAKGDEKRLPREELVEGYLTAIQHLTQEFMAQAKESDSDSDQVRVSGVPYSVDADQIRQPKEKLDG